LIRRDDPSSRRSPRAPPPPPPGRRVLTRRRFLRGLGWSALGLAAAAGYGRWVECDWLSVTRTTVALPAARRYPGVRPLRVLHLSDLHASREWVPWELIARAVALGLAASPDVVCLTGDFVTYARPTDVETYVRILRPLSDAAPTFACLGNHDGRAHETYTGVREVLRAARIELLHNRGCALTVAGRPVQFTGLGDWWLNETRPAAAFAATPPRGDALRLVLNHNPDAKHALAPHDWDLMLCGHTHGGQLGLPIIGRLIAPVWDKRFLAGLYEWKQRHLFITRGVGNLHRARFLCRPEVSLLEIA
jgi:predicted MPP superfamily phosphohydrolase